MTCQTLRARYVFPVAGEPIRNGEVVIEAGAIVACRPARSNNDGVCDFGNAAILPGMVNAHTHLDYSDLANPLGYQGIGFVDWLRLVIGRRVEMALTQQPPVADAHGSGVEESLRVGVTALGDIVQPISPCSAAALTGGTSSEGAAHITAFLELIAPTAARVGEAVEAARRYGAGQGSGAGQGAGLSPHAPYSVRPELLEAVIALANQYEMPVAMHLAESPEEIRWLRDAGGPMGQFLEDLGISDASAMRLGPSPMNYLQMLARAPRSLVVHGNYLGDEEIAFVAAHRDRMSVVYCPRSRDWFSHPSGEAYPLRQLLDAGVVVALGTDGRGSCPDLSIFNEMRFAARRHPAIAPGDILKMGTLSGAKALGLSASRGTIEQGRRADLAVVALPSRDSADAYELLFDPVSTVIACYGGGRTPRIATPRML